MFYFPQNASVFVFLFVMFVAYRIYKNMSKNSALHDAELKSVKEMYRRGYEIRLSDLKHVTAEELNDLHIKFIP